MFVQSKITTHHKQKNGVAIRQRRNKQETLVQWANGDQRWVETNDLMGNIILLDEHSRGNDYE